MFSTHLSHLSSHCSTWLNESALQEKNMALRYINLVNQRFILIVPHHVRQPKTIIQLHTTWTSKLFRKLSILVSNAFDWRIKTSCKLSTMVVHTLDYLFCCRSDIIGWKNFVCPRVRNW